MRDAVNRDTAKRDAMTLDTMVRSQQQQTDA
jgi:hypothetical protein